MTQEQLSEATKLQDQIKETEHMVNALQNGYQNHITAIDYKHLFTGENKEDSVYVGFSVGDELHTLILDYFKHELESLNEKFSKL